MSNVILAQDENGGLCVDLTMGGTCPFSAEIDVIEELSVGDIQDAYLQHPGKAVWWGVLGARMGEELDNMKAEADAVEAELYNVLQYEAAQEKVAATVRDKVIRARRAIHPDYLRSQAVLRKVKAAHQIVLQICKAWDGRREMLISLGAHTRKMAERGGDMRIVETIAAERAREIADGLKNPNGRGGS